MLLLHGGLRGRALLSFPKSPGACRSQSLACLPQSIPFQKKILAPGSLKGNLFSWEDLGPSHILLSRKTSSYARGKRCPGLTSEFHFSQEALLPTRRNRWAPSKVVYFCCLRTAPPPTVPRLFPILCLGLVLSPSCEKEINQSR